MKLQIEDRIIRTSNLETLFEDFKNNNFNIISVWCNPCDSGEVSLLFETNNGDTDCSCIHASLNKKEARAFGESLISFSKMLDDE